VVLYIWTARGAMEHASSTSKQGTIHALLVQDASCCTGDISDVRFSDGGASGHGSVGDWRSV
jgi:hypothetical protein